MIFHGISQRWECISVKGSESLGYNIRFYSGSFALTNKYSPISLFNRLKTLLMGDARSISDPGIFYKLSLIAFFAWVGLGADGLTSACYGPEEAYLALGKHAHLSIFVALGTVITIFVISASYHKPGGVS